MEDDLTNRVSRANVTKDKVLCFPISGEEVLLEYRRVKDNTIIYTGFSGRLERFETPTHAASRILNNKLSIHVKEDDLEERSEITFCKRLPGTRLTTYFVNDWTGMIELDDLSKKYNIELKWFSLNDLPFNVGKTGSLWVPRVLKGEKIYTTVYYDANGKMLPNSILMQDNSDPATNYFF